MLSQAYRDVLVHTAAQVLAIEPTARNFFNSVRPNSWTAIAPIGASLQDTVTVLVEAAIGQGWVRDLAERLKIDYPARAEFDAILVELDRAAPIRTSENPFEEVLLEGDRPFVNRQGLRTHLLNLTDRSGSCVLLVDGQPKTGKTFSFYLINHVAPKKGFVVSRFRMSRLPKPDALAAEILGRIGVDRKLSPIGNESAERWAESLADVIASALDHNKVPRLFVFDDFSDTALPEGTASLIIRLATYADEELRPLLRVVLIRFRDPLTPELEDVALRDDATPFTNTDMIAAVMQAAKARKWAVTEAAIEAKIKEYHAHSGRTLNERFKFLRGLLQQLAGSP